MEKDILGNPDIWSKSGILHTDCPRVSTPAHGLKLLLTDNDKDLEIWLEIWPSKMSLHSEPIFSYVCRENRPVTKSLHSKPMSP